MTSTHPLANQMGDIKDIEDYKHKIEKQAKLRRKTIKAVKEHFRLEDIELIEKELIEISQKFAGMSFCTSYNTPAPASQFLDITSCSFPVKKCYFHSSFPVKKCDFVLIFPVKKCKIITKEVL